MTALCVSLTGCTAALMADEIRAAAEAGADMVELRLDLLDDVRHESLGVLLEAARSFPGEVIATCRLTNEGGHWDGTETDRVSLMEYVGLHGVHAIDFEFAAWKQSANIRQKIGLVCDVNTDSVRPRRKLILSRHDFAATPPNLDAILDELAGEPAHVVKLACTARDIVDSLRMLDALRNSAPHRPTIALGMGQTGIVSRVLARKFGAYLTFASLAPGREAAPGQVPLDDMRTLYRWDAIDADTAVYGVIGCPVGHSMSPHMLNPAFAAAGVNAVYLPLRVEEGYTAFAAFMDAVRARPWLNLRGCSVTIPHKENLIRYAAEQGGTIEPLTQRIGAANTLVLNAAGELSVCNTDYRGAMDALVVGLKLAGPQALAGVRVAVLGAGGVSRAIVAGLADAGAKVAVYNRTADRARQLADEFGTRACPWEQRDQLEADVVINCTSIGMSPQSDQTPWPAPRRSPRAAVFDTVYNPLDTRLLSEARERGAVTIDGAAMFVGQGAAQFTTWTQRPAPLELMREAVLRRLQPSAR